MAMSRPDRSPIHAHDSSPARTGPYSQDISGDQLRINAFDHADVDVAFDPLLTNRRFLAIAHLAVLGTGFCSRFLAVPLRNLSTS